MDFESIWTLYRSDVGTKRGPGGRQVRRWTPPHAPSMAPSTHRVCWITMLGGERAGSPQGATAALTRRQVDAFTCCPALFLISLYISRRQAKSVLKPQRQQLHKHKQPASAKHGAEFNHSKSLKCHRPKRAQSISGRILGVDPSCDWVRGWETSPSAGLSSRPSGPGSTRVQTLTFPERRTWNKSTRPH